MIITAPSVMRTLSGVNTNSVIPDPYVNTEVSFEAGDNYYTATVSILNAVIGSTYWLIDNSGNELAGGVITSANQQITGINAYSSQPLLEIRIRKSSSGVRYIPFKSYFNHHPSGSSVYISQVRDTNLT